MAIGEMTQRRKELLGCLNAMRRLRQLVDGSPDPVLAEDLVETAQECVYWEMGLAKLIAGCACDIDAAWCEAMIVLNPTFCCNCGHVYHQHKTAEQAAPADS